MEEQETSAQSQVISSSSSSPSAHNRSIKSPATTPSPPSLSRLWRPAAQRNLRNQWSNLATYRHEWGSASSTARSHATSLVNSYLSQRYMKHMDLGVLEDMPNIRKKACFKLFKQQELYRSKLLSSYKDMVAVVIHMVKTSSSMRCFLKGTNNSTLVQFSSSPDYVNDTGDAGGIPVFTFWSISSFEKLAQELIRLFSLELNLKRLLVMELISINSEVTPQIKGFNWSDKLYPGEFDDLSKCNLYASEASEPLLPSLEGKKSATRMMQSDHQPDQEVLQVYLTAWLADVNIDKYRVDEIFAVVGEEMHITLS